MCCCSWRMLIFGIPLIYFSWRDVRLFKIMLSIWWIMWCNMSFWHKPKFNKDKNSINRIYANIFFLKPNSCFIQTCKKVPMFLVSWNGHSKCSSKVRDFRDVKKNKFLRKQYGAICISITAFQICERQTNKLPYRAFS